jgi:hypothetical protein
VRWKGNLKILNFQKMAHATRTLGSITA